MPLDISLWTFGIAGDVVHIALCENPKNAGPPPHESWTCMRIVAHDEAGQYLLRDSVIARSYAQTRQARRLSENTISCPVPGDSYWL